MLGTIGTAPYATCEIHVWLVCLAVDPATLARHGSNLSDEERQRALRFHFDRDRNRYITGRGILRAILAQYLEVHPPEIEIRTGDHGKPQLCSNRPGRLDFNVSHSEDTAVIAVGWDRNIGVDVEKVRFDIDYAEVARSLFSANEAKALKRLSTEGTAEAFFSCWTRKEAFVKAIGCGLNLPLDSFDVSVEPDTPARFLRGVDARWQIVSFLAQRGYPAALVYDGSPADVRFVTVDPRSI